MGKLRTALSAIAFTALGSAALAEDSGAAAQANNPLAKTKALNFQNLYTGELTGTDRDANQFFLRYASPFQAFGGDWLMRLTAPVNTIPTANGGDVTGFGDLNVFAAYLLDTGNPAVSFGIGPQLTIPTASEDETGSGKWSLGFANVLFNATDPKFQWGYLLTWQASVGGDEDRKDVNIGALQPFLFYQLDQGWYLRSTGIWTYNFENDNYNIPFGFGIGRAMPTSGGVINAFIEPQYSIAHEGDGQQKWNIFAGLNYQY
ncbi:transporter [Falsihalocynthiibacter sp. SS001]|uniref:transporter n=1 Tax=Falsihalocynthiibacter sp. SS001 TaxID=3349698 RepID=UPI0036D330AF